MSTATLPATYASRRPIGWGHTPNGWLTAKVLALIAYIILGSIALKRGSTKAIRALAWVAALATFGYIVSVALTHDPRGFLTGW